MSSVIQHQKVARRRNRSVNTTFSSTPNTRGNNRLGHTTTGRPGGLLRSAAAVRREQRASNGVGLGSISVGSSVGTATVLPFPSFSNHRLFDFDPQDIPLYSAAIIFALTVNILLLSVGVDRIVLSNAVSQVVLPPQQELITRSLVSPGPTAFPGLDEAMSVDPTRFSRLEVEDYVVQPGDTLSGIALRTGLRMDTLISFNRITDVRRLQAGATYQIPNRDGILHTVRSGESIGAIASRHGVAVNTILDVNDLRNESVTEGQVLFIPGGQMNSTELRIVLGELFAWPTQGRFTSGFGMRPDPFTGQRRFHNGIDLANRPGTPIRAAASGRVVHVEEQIANYGRFVIIRHADGFQTLYAHMNSFNVRLGQSVSRGQQIGTMGSTGRSTGPHLHFSVIHNGTFVNPMRYLH